MFDLAEFIDEKIRGGTGADADDGAVNHIVDCSTGDSLFQFVLGHGQQQKSIRLDILTDRPVVFV
jgi:hypothetical protein